MQETSPLDISEVDGDLVITMPPAGNRWIIGLGLYAGIPWLVLVIGGSIALAILAPPEIKRNAILGAIAANLLFFIVHILAVAGVWLAIYNLRGSEAFIVEKHRVTVARTALGKTVSMRLQRTYDARVVALDTSIPPGKGPHQRLEARTAGTAVRFGAGLNAEEAARVLVRANAALGTAGE